MYSPDRNQIDFFQPPTSLDSPLTVLDLCTNLSPPACSGQLPTPYPQIIGERNCGSYNHCTTSSRLLQLMLLMIQSSHQSDTEEHHGAEIYTNFTLSETPIRNRTSMPPEGSTKAGIPPGCPSLDRGGREADVGLEPRTFQSINSRSNH
ncbi:hypothetical protein T265_07487 [Opisthorchis viverrini]|uniref:Uncharacterized protein n=1 Tax=Opisthorchis viverrini TaxID=6198 RepID=A0A074ZNS1_OPIVI|nr:hypothetical protein T265_07487 [Opisthorchis viverrini]KER24980.1 hypothetical protein T265_07487 [Opisthorchis viverrini]